MNISTILANDEQMQPDYSVYRQNKEIPVLIEKNILRALSHYPELKQTPIDFIFKKRIKSSVMQAQPVFRSLLLARSNRRYRINISAKFQLTKSSMAIDSIPDDVMIGWIGHELGHILDYESKSNAGLVSFGYKYVMSPEYVKKAEIAADTHAVNHGLGSFIISTKKFILNNADLPQRYKDKISRLYLSPDVIMEKVKELEEKVKEIEEKKL